MRPWWILMMWATVGYSQDWPTDRFAVQYYEGTRLAGAPLHTAEEAAIDHDWGFEAPHEDVPANTFSARWRGRFAFDGTPVVFRLRADDGLRLWLDDVLILDAWTGRGGTDLEVVRSPAAGTHRLELAYYDAGGAASVHLSWAPYLPTATCEAPADAWCAVFRPGRDGTGAPTQVDLPRTTSGLDAEAPADYGNDGFQGRYETRITTAEGFYRFTATHRDGVRVWLDGRLLMDAWTDGGLRTTADGRFLSAGSHHLAVENYRTWGRDALSLAWGPDTTTQTYNAGSALGANLSALHYWSTEWTLLDGMKTSGGWYTRAPGVWDTGEQAALDLDAHGWVRSLPAADDASVTYRTVGALLFNGTGGTYPAGRYLVCYEGEGSLAYQFDAGYDAARSRPGRHVLNIPEPGNGGILLEITALNPDNPIRDIRVIPDASFCSLNPWALCGDTCPGTACTPVEDAPERLFHPAFLADLRGNKVLRFMDLLRTNTSVLEDWADRPQPTDARWNSENGVPLEVVAALANATAANAWITLPTRASDGYARGAAQLLLEHLDPARRLYVEYGNEHWNTAFTNGQWVEAMGEATWPDAPESGYTKRINYHGLRTAQLVALFREAWGDQAFRITGVMGGFSASIWPGEQALTCPLATAGGAPPCYAGVDALAIAPYFGAYLGQPRHADDLAALMAAPQPLDLLFQELTLGGVLYDPDDDPAARAPEHGALAQAAGYTADNAAVAARYGLDLIAYEGGQHLSGVGAQQNDDALTELFVAANRDPRMGALYAAYLRDWREAGGGLFCHFLTVGAYGRFGSWGTKEYQQQQDAPKFNALQNHATAYPAAQPHAAPPAPTPTLPTTLLLLPH